MTPARLWALYHKGKAEMYCTIVAKFIFYTLYFRLTKNNQMIVHDDFDCEHRLGMVFTNPHQFLDYTQNHFYQRSGYLN